MIGMINMPSDSPVEYYATNKRKFDFLSSSPARPSSLPELVASSSTNEHAPPPPSPSTKEKFKSSLRLFVHKKTPTMGYCPDGRKCKDGRPIQISAPSQLWDEVLMKKMVQRIGEEITSPVQQLESIDKAFREYNLRSRDRVMSAPSLVSENKSLSGLSLCPACAAAYHENPKRCPSHLHLNTTPETPPVQEEEQKPTVSSSNALLAPPQPLH